VRDLVRQHHQRGVERGEGRPRRERRHVYVALQAARAAERRAAIRDGQPDPGHRISHEEVQPLDLLAEVHREGWKHDEEVVAVRVGLEELLRGGLARRHVDGATGEVPVVGGAVAPENRDVARVLRRAGARREQNQRGREKLRRAADRMGRGARERRSPGCLVQPQRLPSLGGGPSDPTEAGVSMGRERKIRADSAILLGGIRTDRNSNAVSGAYTCLNSASTTSSFFFSAWGGSAPGAPGPVGPVDL